MDKNVNSFNAKALAKMTDKINKAVNQTSTPCGDDGFGVRFTFWDGGGLHDQLIVEVPRQDEPARVFYKGTEIGQLPKEQFFGMLTARKAYLLKLWSGEDEDPKAVESEDKNEGDVL